MLGKKISSNMATGRNRNTMTSISAASLGKHSKPPVVVPPTETELSIGVVGGIPFYKTQDNGKVLPKYTAAIGRPANDLLPADELDGIQLELELLLSTVAQRYFLFKTEYEVLDKVDDRRDRKYKYMDKQPLSPSKKKRMEERTKYKDGSSKHQSGGSSKLSKAKHSIQAQSPAMSQHTDDSMDAMSHSRDNANKLTHPRNDTPNKFWLSVEPYCMPLTQEDIKLLGDLIEGYSGPMIPPIPELGSHYSRQWAIEDLNDEQELSAGSKTSKSRLSNHTNTEVLNILKKGEKKMGENITGPLTQRLVSALLEENLLSSHSPGDELSGSLVSSNSCRGAIGLMKNGINIERRVRKELIEQGLLDIEDGGKAHDDEILTEIKRVRTELIAIAEYNSNELKKLNFAAKEEIRRLETKRKLDLVDQEIIETYKKVFAAKQKRRTLTTAEHDEVFRLTEEQKRLSDQLEVLPLPGSHFIGSN